MVYKHVGALRIKSVCIVEIIIIFFTAALRILFISISLMTGRRLALELIVPRQTVLVPAVMELEELGLYQLAPVFAAVNARPVVEWLAARGLLPNGHHCGQCRRAFTLIARDNVDGCRWRCPGCGAVRSIRSSTFFERSHLQLKDILCIMYHWSIEVPMHSTLWQLGLTWHTLVDWGNIVRDVCSEDVRRHPIQLGGMDDNGDPLIVEIDESKFFNRKYNRGQWREGHWVFGAIERATGHCIVQVVPNRTAATLVALVEEWMLPGTHVMSDGWAAYAGINQLAGGVYLHDVVIHEQNFIHPVHPDIHTQNVECMWMRCKRKLKRQVGTSRELFTTYLREFMWM